MELNAKLTACWKHKLVLVSVYENIHYLYCWQIALIPCNIIINGLARGFLNNMPCIMVICSNIMNNLNLVYYLFGQVLNAANLQTLSISVAHGWPNIDCWVPMLLTYERLVPWYEHVVTGYLFSWIIFRQFSGILRWALIGHL